MAHTPLLLTDRNETFSKMIVVFAHQTVGYLEIIDISEHQGPASCVGMLVFDEEERLVPPVSQWVGMVGGMVAVVEAKTI